MKNEHMDPETKELKDFDIVAHVVKLDGKSFEHHGGNYTVKALYVNRYGLGIGALVQNVNTSEHHSWDPFIWEEYLDSMTSGESGRY